MRDLGHVRPEHTGHDRTDSPGDHRIRSDIARDLRIGRVAIERRRDRIAGDETVDHAVKRVDVSGTGDRLFRREGDDDVGSVIGHRHIARGQIRATATNAQTRDCSRTRHVHTEAEAHDADCARAIGADLEPDQVLIRTVAERRGRERLTRDHGLGAANDEIVAHPRGAVCVDAITGSCSRDAHVQHAGVARVPFADDDIGRESEGDTASGTEDSHSCPTDRSR